MLSSVPESRILLPGSCSFAGKGQMHEKLLLVEIRSLNAAFGAGLGGSWLVVAIARKQCAVHWTW